MATINVTDLELVASWNYNSKNKECVCNRSIHLPTANQVEKKNIYRNDITFGECGHAFHTECINSYLKTYNNMCPLDRLPFTKSENNYKIKYNVIE
jgi:hypothetical protein